MPPKAPAQADSAAAAAGPAAHLRLRRNLLGLAGSRPASIVRRWWSCRQGSPEKIGGERVLHSQESPRALPARLAAPASPARTCIGAQGRPGRPAGRQPQRRALVQAQRRRPGLRAPEQHAVKVPSQTRAGRGLRAQLLWARTPPVRASEQPQSSCSFN